MNLKNSQQNVMHALEFLRVENRLNLFVFKEENDNIVYFSTRIERQ